MAVSTNPNYDYSQGRSIKSTGGVSFAGQSSPAPDPSKSQLYSQLNQVGQGKVAAFNLGQFMAQSAKNVANFGAQAVKNVANTVEAPFKLGQQNQTIDKANQQRQSLTQQFKAGKINKQQLDQGLSGINQTLNQNSKSIQQSSNTTNAVGDTVSGVAHSVTDPIAGIANAGAAIINHLQGGDARLAKSYQMANDAILNDMKKGRDALSNPSTDQATKSFWQQTIPKLGKAADTINQQSQQQTKEALKTSDPVSFAANVGLTLINSLGLGGGALLKNAALGGAKGLQSVVVASKLSKLADSGELDSVLAKAGAEQAVKQASRTVADKAIAGTGKLVKNTTEGAAIGGGYGGLQAASEKGTKTTGKDVLQGIKSGAELGAGLGAGATVASGLVKGAKGGAGKLVESAKTSKETPKSVESASTTLQTKSDASLATSPETKMVSTSKLTSYEGAPDKAKVEAYKQDIQSGKKLEPLIVKKDSSGNLGVEDGKHRLEAYKQLGITKVPIIDKTESPALAAVKSAAEKVAPSVKVKTPAQEGGFVSPGAVSEDITKAKQAIQSHIEQNQRATKFSGDVAQDAHIHEAESQQRLIDSAKVMKKLQGVSKEDRQVVYDYREAKAAGTELPKLTDNQKALHDTITELAKATNANKAEMVRLKVPGYNKDNLYDPEAGNHRIAIGKGASLERFLTGRQGTPLAARSLRTSTSSSKARVFHAITDEKGNRQVAAINNVSVKQGLRSVSKGKFITAIDENGKSTRLGKITPADVKAGIFKGSDGKTYKLSQATTNEITKATGQRYIKDPLTSAMIDFHETRNALDSARMLEKWKTNPDFENIAMKHGEGLAPRGWKTTHLPQMQGYAFEPKVAEVLDDIHGNIADKNKALATINHYLRNAMVAIPIRHNLNEIGFYFTDRGLSSLINPMAYKRGTQALIKATNEVMNQGPLYRKIVSQGFNFMDQNDKDFADAVVKQTKSMLDDQGEAAKLAGDLGTTVTNLRKAYNAIQHKGVWFQQDVLNMSRIIERMDKGASLEEAVRQTERFNPQYRVPSRVAGSRAASQVLRNNNALFFGSYHYDQWKTLANMAKDLAGKNGGRAALQAVDKFGAMALGIWATHALIDKGLQAFSGNNNAYTKPFGALDFPDQLYQLVTGKKDVNAVLQSQIFPSVGINVIAQLFENRDFFTGKQIRDPNMPQADQVKQIGDWLDSQNPISQQITGAQKGGSLGSAAATIALGAHFPKNSPSTNTLYQLKYDTLPNIQSQARKQAQSGDIQGAKATISQYDTLLLAAAKKALQDAGKPVPSDQVLIGKLKKSQYYYQPKDATVQKWATERPKTITDTLGR